MKMRTNILPERNAGSMINLTGEVLIQLNLSHSYYLYNIHVCIVNIIVIKYVTHLLKLHDV